MRDRRGSGPALLNVPVFMRAVKLSMQSGWQAWTYTESYILTTLYLSTFNIRLNAGVGICYFPSAHLSTPLCSLSASASINYTQLRFSFLIAVRLGFMVNNRFFLPVEEFPLWNSLVPLIGGSGEVKLSCIGKEEHQPFYLFSLHGNDCVSLCTQSKGSTGESLSVAFELQFSLQLSIWCFVCSGPVSL